MATAVIPKLASKTVIASETEIELHRIIYNWDINNFDRICTPESEEFEPISSTPFTAGAEINRESEWDLILSAEGGYLQIWLYLKKIFKEVIKEISVNLTVLILKADGSTLLRRRCDKNQTFTTEDNGWGMGFIITIEQLWSERETYLHDNRLRLQIQLDVLGDVTSKLKAPGAFVESLPLSGKRKREEDSTLSRDMKKLLKSQNDADFSIHCGGKVFPVHKLVLGARSKVFAAMFKHPTIESSSNKVKVEDVHELTMEHLLEYIYTGGFTSPSDPNELMSLVEASDKYELNEMKNRCLRSLCAIMSPDNVGRIAVLSYLHNAEVIIQEEIRQYCRSNWESLLKKKSFKDCLISQPRAFFDDIKGLD